ncbi:uncharacterized protein F5147DRAFT_822780 [Suillus discolor]|uniref:Uncharacterized protein n=1 Tax=Suillus discolor TaxID=1912936 RepID=A0A9P7JN70_9AGAM|nr:uncharacterized protein F5147DRAFT_822780 [Suillus discolor]KAG2091809.1 hypothetical protein F5147DRAFT_822780 [Suillus discolor]
MLGWETWKHLSHLPTLLKLEIDRGYEDPPSLSNRDIVNLSFLNITSLSFRQLYNSANIITVMQHSQFPSLKEFKFRANYLSLEEAEQLFHALSHCKACRTLEEIIICCLEAELQSHEFLTPTPHFLCFTQLQTLQLMFTDFCISLDNDMLLQAMSIWPHIRTLEIDYLDAYIFSSEVTLHGLFTALSLCPHLHRLKIPINIATIDVDPDAEPIQHTSLRSLELETSSEIADPETLAGIISAWLPCIYRVQNLGVDWDEVNMDLRFLKVATAPYGTYGSLLK